MHVIQPIFLIGLLTAISLPVGASVVVSTETDIAPANHSGPYTPTFSAGGPSKTDILEGLLPSDSNGNFELAGFGGLPALTNGTVETTASLNPAEQYTSEHYAIAGLYSNAGQYVTYDFGGSYNIPHNIQSIVVYGGWFDTGRDAQHYTISTSLDGTSFIPLTTYSNGYGVNQGASTVSHRSEFTDDTNSYLATNIRFLRLDFLEVENGYTGYTEIDVFAIPNYIPIPIPGDLNFDGLVNSDDFQILTDHMFTVPSAIGLDGDLNYDNFVDVKDFRIWKEATEPYFNFTPTSLTIPEPSANLLGFFAFAFIAMQRRYPAPPLLHNAH